MDENGTNEDWKRKVDRRLSILEAAIFAKPAGDLPEDRHEAKQKVARQLKESKILGYISKNNVSKTELSMLATKVGVTVSSIFTKEEMVEAILDKYSLDDPIKEIRDKTKIFINENNIALSTVKCDLQCETCPEHRVVLCQMYNANQIDNYFNE